jgi:hypothetical protein
LKIFEKTQIDDNQRSNEAKVSKKFPKITRGVFVMRGRWLGKAGSKVAAKIVPGNGNLDVSGMKISTFWSGRAV